MNDPEGYNVAFREWFEANITNDADFDLQQAIYKPMYAAFIAGAQHALDRIEKARDSAPETS